MAMTKSKTFADAMNKVPEKVFKEAKKVKAGGDFTVPKISDGKYKARLSSAECGIGGKGKIEGVPFIRFVFVVFGHPDAEGVKLEKFHTIKNFSEDLPRVIKTFKGMGYEFDEDDDTKPSDLENYVKQASDDHPEVLLTVKNGEYDKEVNGKVVKQPKLEVWTDRALSKQELTAATAAKAKKK